MVEFKNQHLIAVWDNYAKKIITFLPMENYFPEFCEIKRVF
jgi:hypothetical protein